MHFEHRELSEEIEHVELYEHFEHYEYFEHFEHFEHFQHFSILNDLSDSSVFLFKEAFMSEFGLPASSLLEIKFVSLIRKCPDFETEIQSLIFARL